MEKIEYLQKLNPYLPYDLGVISGDPYDTDDRLEHKGVMSYQHSSDENARTKYFSITEIAFSDNNIVTRLGVIKRKVKPLLHPVSDLYKEIDGEVGIVEIAKISSGTIHVDRINGACKNLSYFRCTFEDGIDELIINERCEGWYRSYFDKNQPNTGRNIIDQFEVFTYLFSHHYDIYGLIDKGLAIDLNSISHE